MKPTNKTINTIPDGVWEAGETNESLHTHQKQTPSTDLQENGYPVPSHKAVTHLSKASDLSESGQRK